MPPQRNLVNYKLSLTNGEGFVKSEHLRFKTEKIIKLKRKDDDSSDLLQSISLLK